MRSLAVRLIALAFWATPWPAAVAQMPAAAQTPGEVVRGIYERTAKNMIREEPTPIIDLNLSREMLSLSMDALISEVGRPDVQALIQSSREQQVILFPEQLATGCIDCRELGSIEVARPVIADDGKVSVRASYKLDGMRREMTVDLVAEKGRWVVDNIRAIDGTWNLKERFLHSRNRPGGPYSK
jgi:hypothetical protein